ncbi:MAG TPA: trypsin-like serine protease [Solirubrobacterales bacterium]|nr:trypsin-like serine protease [Solirubrobacterales bacterium]
MSGKVAQFSRKALAHIASGAGAVRAYWVAALFLACMALPAGAPAQTAQTPIEPGNPTAEQVADYAAENGLGHTDAEHALSVQAAATGIVQQLEAVLGGGYAGVWFDDKSGQLVIPVVAQAQADRAFGLVKSLTIDSSSRIVAVRSSWDELEAAQEQINSGLGELIKGQLAQTWLDARRNAVVVRVPANAEAGVRSSAAEVAAAAKVSVVIETADGLSRFSSRPYACFVPEASCDRPPRAGIFIGPAGVAKNLLSCTAGFKAIGNTFGNRFMLTAGHCYKDSADWRAWDGTELADHYLGHIEAGAYPGDDYAAIRVNGYGDWWEEGPTGFPSTVVYWGGDQNIPVQAESSSYLGESACMSGWASKSSCGTVTRIDFTNTYEDGSTVNHLTELHGNTLKAGPGDSGGPVWTGNTALGLISGGPEDSTRVYYTEVTRDTAALGVSVGPQVGAPPYAETTDATNVQGRQVSANAKVDPNGVETSYAIEYGPLSEPQAYESKSQTFSAGSGFDTALVSHTIQGLVPLKTYAYRVVAWSSAGTSYGMRKQFETPVGAPLVSFPTQPTRFQTSTVLAATVEPGGAETTYQFEYGPTTSYGLSGPAGKTGATVGSIAVGGSIGGLTPETTYHFRVKASNSAGTTYSPDQTFTTLANTIAYGSTFGSSGKLDGQFSRPLAMVADAPGGVPSGDVWIVDKLINRVQKFNAKGQFVSKFGSFGTGNGQFNEPRAITVDSEGNLWVADAGNNRIEKFNSKGEYLTEIDSEGGFGFNSIDIPSGLAIARGGHIFVANQGSGGRIVELLTTKTGLLGGYVNNAWLDTTTPANMATDSQGDVWIADAAENKLYEIPSSGGGPVARFGTTGSGPGQLSAPYAVAAKPSGTLLVSDRGNNRVQQFSQTGELLASFGKGGEEAGQFCEPSGLALSSRGVIFVADACHDKIQRWTQKTSPEAVTQPATGVTATGATLSARINPSGLATTYKFEYGKTSSYGSNVPASPGSLTASFEDSTVTAALTGLVPDTTYHRRIVATNAEGTTYGKDRTFVTTSGTATFTSSFASLGPEGGSLNRPLGMAAEVIAGVPTGNFWIVDNKNNRVVKVNSAGSYIRQVGGFGTANGQFDSPRGVAVDDQGNIWVTDAGNHRIQKFNAKGEFLMRIRSSDVTGSSALETPSGIAIGREGHIFVGDQGLGGVILELSDTAGSEGKFEAWRYTSATNPTQLASDEDGDVWAIDYQDNKVYEVPDSGGAPVVRFGTGGTGPGQLSSPYGIAIKPNGNILISNRGNNLIQQFSPSGAYQFQFGAGGTGAGQFSEPSGMAVGPDGSVYIADAGNSRVQRWSFK